MNLLMLLDQGEDRAAYTEGAGDWIMDAAPAHEAGAAQRETAAAKHAMALLTLSHTPVEHQLYGAMFLEVTMRGAKTGCFSVRRLLRLTHLRSYSTIRRGLAGLINKLSIEPMVVAGDDTPNQDGVCYLVHSPAETFARRCAAGRLPYPPELQAYCTGGGYGAAVACLAGRHDLSRRETQVALCCAEGLTNAEIGARLFISEQTVKFHLRHIFAKLRVKRRAELVSLLLRQERESYEND